MPSPRPHNAARRLRAALRSGPFSVPAVEVHRDDLRAVLDAFDELAGAEEHSRDPRPELPVPGLLDQRLGRDDWDRPRGTGW